MPHAAGTGMIPARFIRHYNPKHGVPNAVDTIWVNHVTGKVSSIQFRSYDQGRVVFQGTAKQGVWLDEEPDPDIVAECAMRTMTTGGMLIYTFAPVQGLTPFVTTYLETADLYVPDGPIVPAHGNFWRD